MSVLVTADLHFSNNPRDQYRHDWQRRLRMLAREHKVSAVVILGDLCEAKDSHPAPLVNAVVNHIYRLSRVAPVFILMGNHDYVSWENPYFAFLHRIDAVSWMGAITVTGAGKNALTKLPEVAIRALERLGRVLWLPHTPDYLRDWKGVDFKADWIFAHQTFAGASLGTRSLDGIPTDIFPRGSRIISGDIHKPQIVGPVTYVGAPYTKDFGDDYEPRVLLIEGNRVKSISCEGPQKRLLEISSLKQLERWERRLAPGDILKVRVLTDASDYAKWGATADRIRSWGEERGFVVHMVQPVVQSEPLQLKARKLAPKTDEELLKAYVKRNGVDERTLKIGLELLK